MYFAKGGAEMNKEIVARLFRDPPVLRTQRLLLRRLQKNDCLDMHEYSRDAEVTKYLTWEPHPDPHYTMRYLTYIIPKYRTGDFHDWAVIHKESGKMIGTCGFTSFNYAHNSAEIGYVLNRRFWGKGLAAEAIRAVMRVGFFDLNLHRIEAKYMIGNAQSRRVMEKCGMQFEGIQRDAMYIKNQYETIGICSILSADYIALENR